MIMHVGFGDDPGSAWSLDKQTFQTRHAHKPKKTMPAWHQQRIGFVSDCWGPEETEHGSGCMRSKVGNPGLVVSPTTLGKDLGQCRFLRSSDYRRVGASFWQLLCWTLANLASLGEQRSLSWLHLSLARSRARSLTLYVRRQTPTHTHTHTHTGPSSDIQESKKTPHISTSILDLGILDLPPVQLVPVITVFTGPDRVSISKIQRRPHINLGSWNFGFPPIQLVPVIAVCTGPGSGFQGSKQRLRSNVGSWNLGSPGTTCTGLYRGQGPNPRSNTPHVAGLEPKYGRNWFFLPSSHGGCFLWGI